MENWPVNDLSLIRMKNKKDKKLKFGASQVLLALLGCWLIFRYFVFHSSIVFAGIGIISIIIATNYNFRQD